MPRALDHVYANLVGEVQAGKRTQRPNLLDTSSVHIEIENTFTRPVFWRAPNNLIHVEAPGFGTTQDEGIFIHITYTFSTAGRFDSRGLLDDLGLPENHVERKGIYDALQLLEKKPGWGMPTREFTYTLAVRREHLDQVGGIAYINDIDMVVGYEEHAHHAVHPYSKEGQRQRVGQWVPKDDGFVLNVLIVDNAGVFGSRWYNSGLGTYEIRPVVTNELADGVYITHRVRHEENPTATHYSFEEADKTLALYVSRAEAETHGSPKDQHKQRVLEREQELEAERLRIKEADAELQRQKRATTAEKERLDKERAEREQAYKEEDERRRRERTDEEQRMAREKEALEHQRQQFRYQQDMDRDRFKYEYERDQQKHKSQNEQQKALLDALKTVLGIVSIGLSIYATVQKSKK